MFRNKKIYLKCTGKFLDLNKSFVPEKSYSNRGSSVIRNLCDLNDSEKNKFN